MEFSGILNEASSPGLVVGLVDNQWDDANVYYNRYAVQDSLVVLPIGTHQENTSADITSWFDGATASIQPGDVLSVKVFRSISGNRRARTDLSVTAKVSFRKTASTSIIVPDAAIAGQLEAANWLQALLTQGMDAKPMIYSASAAPTSGYRIYVGYGAHVPVSVSPPTAPEGLVIQEEGGSLYLLGEIAAAGINNSPVARDRGVLHAVTTFAETLLGYRFLFSVSRDVDPELFELGTYIPDIVDFDSQPASYISSGLFIQDAPFYQHRLYHGMPTGMRGLKSGSSVDYTANHAHDVQEWYAMYGSTHPELFVLKADGTRDWNHLDYAEPMVLEKELEHLETFFSSGGTQTPGMFMPPTDKYIIEVPTDNYPISYSSAAQALVRSGSVWGRQSDIWFEYIRQLAEEVEIRWPDKRVATIAYQWYSELPSTSIVIPDNVDIMLSLMRSSTQNKQTDVYNYNLSLLQQWYTRLGGDRDRLFLWEYWVWPSIFITPPTISPYSMQDWLQDVETYASGVFINGGGEPLQYQYLMYRLWLDLLWDPDIDVQAEIQDLCNKFYGSAGSSMRDFYSRLISRYEIEWSSPLLSQGQYYADPELYYEQSYSTTDIEYLSTQLEDARETLGLNSDIETIAQSGTAIYLLNVHDTEVPVRITLSAVDSPIINPSVGWQGGRLTWAGTLQPGEELSIDEAGAELRQTSGTTVGVSGLLAGLHPSLMPGRADVVYLWHKNTNPETEFEVRLDYGESASLPMLESEIDILGKRLNWLRDAYAVLHPTNSVYDEKQGFFAEAFVAQHHLGRRTAYDVMQVAQLPGSVDSDAWDGVSAFKLVEGNVEGSTPYDIFGFKSPVDTCFKIVYKPGVGMAIRIEAEEALSTNDLLTFQFGTLEVELDNNDFISESAPVEEFLASTDHWTALIKIDWADISTSISSSLEPGVDYELDTQVSMEGSVGKIWAPTLSTPWGENPKSIGLLRFLAPTNFSAEALEAVNLDEIAYGASSSGRGIFLDTEFYLPNDGIDEDVSPGEAFAIKLYRYVSGHRRARTDDDVWVELTYESGLPPVTVAADLSGSVNSAQSPGSGAGSPGYIQSPRLRWGNSGDGSGEWQGWLKFSIPEVPGHVIGNVYLELSDIVDETASPGLVIGLANNGWDASSIYYDRYTAQTSLTAVSVGSHQASTLIDISSWFDGTEASIQPGSELTVRVYRAISGNRRARTDSPASLEIQYIPDSEPLVVATVSRGSHNSFQAPGRDAANPGYLLSPRLRWGNSGDGSGEWQSWMKFVMPAEPDIPVASAVLKFSNVYNELGYPGMVADLVESSWNGATIYYDQYASDETKAILPIGGNDVSPELDITDWMFGERGSMSLGELSPGAYSSLSFNIDLGASQDLGFYRFAEGDDIIPRIFVDGTELDINWDPSRSLDGWEWFSSSIPAGLHAVTLLFENNNSTEATLVWLDGFSIESNSGPSGLAVSEMSREQIFAYVMGVEQPAYTIPATVTKVSDSVVEYVYRQSASAYEMDVILQVSTDLVHWSNAETLEQSIIETGDSWNMVKHTVSVDPSFQSQFFRLNIQYSGDE